MRHRDRHGESLDAVQAAADALQELNIDLTEPVDPFDAIDSLGLELVFAPLDNLLGAIVPAPSPGGRSGVLITTERPASIQRFTAAHEIGHWYLDQDHLEVDIPIDTEQEVTGIPSSQRERRAQLFAAYFLTPRPLVGKVARRHGYRRGQTITPVQAYSIARDMHVSYEAAVRQLRNYKLIEQTNMTALLKVQPMAPKEYLARGHHPTRSRGDVWQSMPTVDGQLSFEVLEGDDVVIALPENRTTGFRWMTQLPRRRTPMPSLPSFDDVVGVVSPGFQLQSLRPVQPEINFDQASLVYEDFQVNDIGDDAVPPKVGGGGTRYLVVNAQSAGEWTAHLLYATPFEPTMPPVSDVFVRFTVRSQPPVEFRQRRLREFAESDD